MKSFYFFKFVDPSRYTHLIDHEEPESDNNFKIRAKAKKVTSIASTEFLKFQALGLKKVLEHCFSFLYVYMRL
jgi:hypothetical protein